MHRPAYNSSWNVNRFIQRLTQYTVLLTVVVIVFIPIIMLVFGALKTRGELMAHPYTLPIPPRWENIFTILTSPRYSASGRAPLTQSDQP